MNQNSPCLFDARDENAERVRDARSKTAYTADSAALIPHVDSTQSSLDRKIRRLEAESALRDWTIRLDRERSRQVIEMMRNVAPAPDPTPPAASEIPLELSIDLRRAMRVVTMMNRFFPSGTRRRRIAKTTFAAARTVRAAIVAIPIRFRDMLYRPINIWDESAHPQPVFDEPDRAIPDLVRIDDGVTGILEPKFRFNVSDGRIPSVFDANVCVLSSSQGNYFFDEIRDLIVSGFRELGVAARSGDESDWRDDSIDLRVVVAPHEFFYLGAGEAARDAVWPRGTILVGTEQPSTPWFEMALPCLRRATAVWDIDAETTAHLRSLGITCEHLPLGFAASYAPFERVGDLPLTSATCHLAPAIRRAEAARRKYHDRPIDVLFIGGKTPRREAFFAAASPSLADYHCYLYISSLNQPHIPGSTTTMDTRTAIGLSRRSRVMLNVHRGEDRYFEWHRIVLHGLWQGTLVVTEPSGMAPPFRSGIDYVEAEAYEFPSVLEYYLNDPVGRERAEEIARSGRETLTRECRLATVLAELSAKLSGDRRRDDESSTSRRADPVSLRESTFAHRR